MALDEAMVRVCHQNYFQNHHIFHSFPHKVDTVFFVRREYVLPRCRHAEPRARGRTPVCMQSCPRRLLSLLLFRELPQSYTNRESPLRGEGLVCAARTRRSGVNAKGWFLQACRAQRRRGCLYIRM